MTQTVPDISPFMPMHQDPLLVQIFWSLRKYRDDDDDGDGDGDGDPCKNALTAPEPLLASARSFSNISTILVLKST